ncbi:MAG: hypothetical protein COU29_00985 [Candidatus Magasanikbacteria bacterium CG10_big_fil_rev_8_21_14_0_10_36_32]|uniref:Uncharacterized protein n=1 Tax=Candidatus Magasanikbacteria bacterium CG10_big_fil_rev_8_21_14_0_10_36_32 TaxID=1974646 RepID=A0A2M6W6C9_9BACT|nr:MAG: hypothetical protein COU29_00985 [Candidatus Magasanikbacteria bacterium CG10_big_fil_rev_8_21_14_0_10_36_32]
MEETVAEKNKEEEKDPHSGWWISICGIIIFLLGLMLGTFICLGDSETLGSTDTGDVYNFIAFVDKNAPNGTVEAVISDTDDPDDHHFISMTKKCAATYHKGARYVLVVNLNKCIWLP